MSLSIYLPEHVDCSVRTGSASLIDGSIERLSSIRITDYEAKDMELHPRPVDIQVTRLPGESGKNIASQLHVAVRELLRQIGDEKKPTGSLK